MKKINYTRMRTGSLIRKTYRRIFLNYNTELERAISDCKSLLDVGCGGSSPIQSFYNKIYSVGIDIFKKSIRESKKRRIHHRYFIMNALNIDKKFRKESFDCVLASDLIEHLNKDDGYRLIKMMEEISIKKVIVFTPNGFLKQSKHDNNPYQLHKSGWTIKEMKNLGYSVTGINGIKWLRGAYANIKFKPRFFWNLISDITQLYTKNHPRRAFQILCIKNVSKS